MRLANILPGDIIRADWNGRRFYAPVVGSSTTGQGHVCKGHNELEWGQALCKYDPPLSRNLLRDSERSLAA